MKSWFNKKNIIKLLFLKNKKYGTYVRVRVYKIFQNKTESTIL